MRKVRVAVFASGRGSNAKALIAFANQEDSNYEIGLIISNKKSAKVLDLAGGHDIPQAVINRNDLYHSDNAIQLLQSHRIDCIALAGFLWLIPESLVASFPNRILNIHPALLPRYGGKGMYGLHIHKAVKENQDPVSGMTIHYVNEKYDEGDIIFQSRCQLTLTDSAQEIGDRVLQLEHHFYPIVLNGFCNQLKAKLDLITIDQ